MVDSFSLWAGPELLFVHFSGFSCCLWIIRALFKLSFSYNVPLALLFSIKYPQSRLAAQFTSNAQTTGVHLFFVFFCFSDRAVD